MSSTHVNTLTNCIHKSMEAAARNTTTALEKAKNNKAGITTLFLTNILFLNSTIKSLISRNLVQRLPERISNLPYLHTISATALSFGIARAAQKTSNLYFANNQITPAQNNQQTDDAQPVEAQENTEQTDDAQQVNTEQTDDTQPVKAQENTEQTDDAQPVNTKESTEQTDDAQPVNTKENTEQTDDAQPVNTKENTEQTDDAQPVKTKESTEQTDDAQPVNTKENTKENTEENSKPVKNEKLPLSKRISDLVHFKKTDGVFKKIIKVVPLLLFTMIATVFAVISYTASSVTSIFKKTHTENAQSSNEQSAKQSSVA